MTLEEGDILTHTTGLFTCAIAHSFVLHNVIVLERLKDLNLPLKVAQVFSCAVLELFHCHHLACTVLQRVIPAHLYTAKVPLQHKRASSIINNKINTNLLARVWSDVAHHKISYTPKNLFVIRLLFVFSHPMTMLLGHLLYALLCYAHRQNYITSFLKLICKT